MKLPFGLLLGTLLLSFSLSAQQDSLATIVGSNTADTLRTDSSKVIEDAPLDIAQNRGLFIVTPDRNMQLRILGSVRYLVVFDNRDLPTKNSFNTYFISVGESDQSLPNYYNGLDQTRLGFEVTRNTNQGNVFVRLETDFASPTGSVIVRTPQIRYTFNKFLPNANLAVGLEYAIPELSIPDSLRVKAFQLIPDITFRIDRTVPWGSLQLSGIIPTLSGRTSQNDLILRPGYGLAVSTTVNSWAGGKWYFQGVGGRAITRFFTDLKG